jgi:hypothetical protein
MIAKIENNIVVQVIEGSVEWATENLGGTWIDCESQACGIGYVYNSNTNNFTPPQPYESWTLENNVWKAPFPYPNNNLFYDWNEDKQTWVQINFK